MDFTIIIYFDRDQINFKCLYIFSLYIIENERLYVLQLYRAVGDTHLELIVLEV